MFSPRRASPAGVAPLGRGVATAVERARDAGPKLCQLGPQRGTSAGDVDNVEGGLSWSRGVATRLGDNVLLA